MKKINFEFEEGKGVIALYRENMQKIYDDYVSEINDIKSTREYFLDELDEELESYLKRGLRFIHTWDIMMNDLEPSDRNLLLAMGATDNDYDEVLSYFNGRNCNVKNKRTLSVMVCKARRNLRELYKEKYKELI